MEDKTLYGKTVEFNKGRNALVFIHGGAWIDVDNTPWDFQSLCQDILKLDYQCGLYGIEYRLSPGVKHPTHLKDVIENLYRLVNDQDLDQLQLVGHSVGATLAWQVATCELDDYKVRLVKSKLNAIWLVDGIYSILELLEEYPDYSSFVSKAFDDVPFEEPDNLII
ncbi:Alpha/Beta hydrolase protein [Zygosaccharomyces rouxii]|nr:Alpha/Beta hydrolase protein [Zygosaccharomyces rouxii]